MKSTERHPTNCPRCLGGRIFTDRFNGEAYCINCGWRERKVPAFVAAEVVPPRPRRRWASVENSLSY